LGSILCRHSRNWHKEIFFIPLVYNYSFFFALMTAGKGKEADTFLLLLEGWHRHYPPPPSS
jgi:hypothetical protein